MVLDLIEEFRQLSAAPAFAIGQQIAAALAFAHQRGLVHRDIKPQNILLTTEEQVKVTDFGIARHAAGVQVTRPGVVLGTAAYLAPEQAMGQPAQPASDLYALGVVLFELLTGRLPFQAESTVGLALQQVQEPAPSPRQFNTAIPAEAAAVVLRALAKDPAARYRSAAEFGLALQQGALPESGQTTTFHPVGQQAGAAPPGSTTVIGRRRPPPPPPSAPTPVPTSPPILDVASASGLVQQFYQDINAQAYDAAYNLLRNAWQQQVETNFVSGFATTHNALTMLSTAPAAAGRYIVAGKLAATHIDGVVQYYRGTYTVGWERRIA